MPNITRHETRRVAQGVYDITVGTIIGSDRASTDLRFFELERYPDGAWLLFAVKNASGDRAGGREYLSDFRTKRDAVAAAINAAKEG